MGFVQLNDSLKNWAWINDPKTFYTYGRLMLDAAWSDKEVGNVHLQRGQLVISQREYAKSIGLSYQEFRTILERLKSTQKITQSKSAKFTIITLVEYDCDTSPITQKATSYQRDSNAIKTQCQRNDNAASLLLKQTYRHTDNQTNARTREAPEPKSSDVKQPNKIEKRKFAEFVSMTNDEYSSLVTELGEQGAKRCIEILDNYKGQSGKTYKSDYRAIRNWVITRYGEEQAKRTQQPQSKTSGAFNTGNPFLDMLRDLEEREANEIDIQGNVTDNGDT